MNFYYRRSILKNDAISLVRESFREKCNIIKCSLRGIPSVHNFARARENRELFNMPV